MNLLLQVGARVAKRAHDHIGADAAIERHIAARKIQGHIGGIVVEGLANLLDRAGDDLVIRVRVCCERGEENEQKRQERRVSWSWGFQFLHEASGSRRETEVCSSSRPSLNSYLFGGVWKVNNPSHV